jgi:hypothetical protein
MSFQENKHGDNKDDKNRIISSVDTTGAVFVPPSASIPATINKSATGVVTSVHGVVPGTTVVFDNQITQ